MLKILQARLQEYVHHELPDFQAGSRTVKGIKDQIANIRLIMEKAREFQENIWFTDYAKVFGTVHKAEIDVFLELSRFLSDPTSVCNLISGSSCFSKTSLNIWNFLVHVLLKPGLENFEHYLLACEMNAILQ